MPQVFNRRANSIAKLSIVGVFLVAAAAVAVGVVLDNSGYNTGAYVEKEQPIQFPHSHHSGQEGISCRYCHTSVEVAANAGLPPTQTCMNCHTQIWADSPYLEPVRASWRENKPIEWVKVHDLPDYSYFNHSAHVVKGVGCSTCHGKVENMALVYQVAPLKMNWCINCHSQPELYLRPRDQIYNSDWQPGPNQVQEGLKLKEQYKVLSSRVLTSCSTCHH